MSFNKEKYTNFNSIYYIKPPINDDKEEKMINKNVFVTLMH